MMIFGILGSVSIVLFLVICAIASSDEWHDEIQGHYDSQNDDFDWEGFDD